MMFQALNTKGRQFLELSDDDLQPIINHSNSLCARASRAIVNHASIGEYCLRFFSQEEFKCPCGQYPIKTRRHILYECRRFNNYWNPRWDTIAHFMLFLEFNSNAFSFGESIT